MPKYRLVPLLLVPLFACRGGPEPAFVQLTEARKLVAEMRVDLAKASTASDRAVMADTDEESSRFAREAKAAVDRVSADLPKLSGRLSGLGHARDADQLARFQEAFARYRAAEGEILGLAVENTNLKAQRLSFGSIREAADAFCADLQALASSMPGAARCRASDAVTKAQLAVREIQILQAPHIAEAKDSEMDRIEGEMSQRQKAAREALQSLEQSTGSSARASTQAAKAALDRFESLSRELIQLSRKNSNVRSLELALRRKPALTFACDEILGALQEALGRQGFSGTR